MKKHFRVFVYIFVFIITFSAIVYYSRHQISSQEIEENTSTPLTLLEKPKPLEKLKKQEKIVRQTAKVEQNKLDKDAIILPKKLVEEMFPLKQDELIVSGEDQEFSILTFLFPPPAKDTIEKNIIKGKIKNGDTIAIIFSPYASNTLIHNLINSVKSLYNLAKINVGKPYILEYTDDKKLSRFTYEINRDEYLVINVEGDTFKAERKAIEYDLEIDVLSNTISSSFFEAFIALGEQASLAITLADIFSFDIDFIKDIHKNDTFTVLVEKLSRNGKFSHYGRTLAASFVNQGNVYEAFYFAVPSDPSSAKYYTRKGESIQKMLLKAPLSFTRVTSGYSMNRFHPILKRRRPHQGIDYGAPRGTPIRSVGDGRVTYAGWRGGFGKHVTIRHGGGFESMYSHMSRYGRGIKKGARVNQGQMVGAVGSTGLSTGPHLDFRLKRHGKYVNPQKIVSPRVNPVPKKHLDTYLEQVILLDAYLKEEEALNEYDPQQVL